jgi:hypothetical protein
MIGTLRKILIIEVKMEEIEEVIQEKEEEDRLKIVLERKEKDLDLMNQKEIWMVNFHCALKSYLF